MDFLSLGQEEFPDQFEYNDMLGESTPLRERLGTPGDYGDTVPFSLDAFYIGRNWCAYGSVYVSPDGQLVRAITNSRDVYSGEERITTQQFRWRGDGYVLEKSETRDKGELLIEAVEEALRSSYAGEVLQARDSLHAYGGMDGDFFAQLPAELVLPLWHFFRFNAVERYYGFTVGIEDEKPMLDSAGVRKSSGWTVMS